MIKPESFLLLLLFLLISIPTYSLESDNQAPIHVEADLLEVDEANNTSTYTGKVKLVQGSLSITSEKLIIHFDDKGDLLTMEMYGKPAIFNQLDNEGKPMRGQANRLDYRQQKSILDLSGEAEFEHDGDFIQSQKITINTELDTIDAGGKNNGDRVQMTIQPRQE